METDLFETIDLPQEAETKIDRSRFLAIAVPLKSEADFAGALENIEKRHFDATHHCWAYRLFGDGQPRQRSSDAGEPSGTAGKPILAAIEGSALFDVGVVVVRWYGGIKLGTGGLSRAYRESAVTLLRSAVRSPRFLYRVVTIEVPYSSISSVYRLLRSPDVVLATEEFGEQNRFKLRVRTSLVDALTRDLTERRISHRLERTEIGGGNS